MDRKNTEKSGGKLKIGGHWNAISIIALSQNNPLKAIAEFVENSIDAGAKNITVVRGKQKGDYYLKVIDDGEGISDFSYVATHIGDSIKRKLKKSGVRVRIVDRATRKEMTVEPRKFHGTLLHNLPEAASPLGDIYTELYLSPPSAENAVGLYKGGTRVLPDITVVDRFHTFPWTSDYLEGIVDASFLQLTPGTRDGVVFGSAFESFAASLEPIEEALAERIREQQRAEEEEASRAILQKVTRALKEAFLLLPQEDYGWLNIHGKTKTPRPEGGQGEGSLPPEEHGDGGEAPLAGEDPTLAVAIADERAAHDQKEFFDFAGPLFSFTISPASAIVGVGCKRKLRGIARDRSRRVIETGVEYSWSILEGSGSLYATDAEYVEFTAPAEPGLLIIEGRTAQGEEEKRGQAAVTVTAELLPDRGKEASRLKRGLPGYTYRRAPGELWRSLYAEENLK